MKAIHAVCIVLVCSSLAGCESLRFAPSEAQKQNAWLHNRTTMIALQQARNEASSAKLQALCDLSDKQSRAFVGFCGLPKEFPKADNAEDILSESNYQLAEAATGESLERPDTWQVADSMLELAIAISALAGGVYGTRATRFLKNAKAKSKALEEIIEGNELFKQTSSEQVEAFKNAHRKQSPQTRQIVAATKYS